MNAQSMCSDINLILQVIHLSAYCFPEPRAKSRLVCSIGSDGAAAAERSTPSQRATTAAAMQLPSRLTDVRAMSISASAPSSSATPESGRPNECQRSGQDHQRRARHRGHAFAGQHQRQHHQELLAERHVDARGLRDEERCHAKDTSVLPSRLKL